MRINTGRRTVSTVNFASLIAGPETVWEPEHEDKAEWLIQDMADAHLSMGEEFGDRPEVWEYDIPGLYVVALATGGVVDTVVTIAWDDLMRVHTALRTGREMSVRYAKADGEVTRRRLEPQSLSYTRSRDIVLRAYDERREDTRTFRWDRVTHTTLHRTVRRAAPTKAGLWAQFQAAQAVPAPAEPSWWLYDTDPDTPAARTAPEDVQNFLAESWSLGHRYAKVYI